MLNGKVEYRQICNSESVVLLVDDLIHRLRFILHALSIHIPDAVHCHGPDV
jgi:hypothetical protein